VDGVTADRYQIGKAARRAGTTVRTLRYYQELGLLSPAETSAGGTRLYTDAEVERLQRIIELREVLGLDLGRIGEILRSEDRLAELRTESRRGTTSARRSQIIREAIDLNAHMREQVAEKLAALRGFLANLETVGERYHELLAEHEAPQPDRHPHRTGRG
jgi:DNA-binding transcriptional MerR regulator